VHPCWRPRAIIGATTWLGFQTGPPWPSRLSRRSIRVGRFGDILRLEALRHSYLAEIALTL
jgi:hypothetical protein